MCQIVVYNWARSGREQGGEQAGKFFVGAGGVDSSRCTLFPDLSKCFPRGFLSAGYLIMVVVCHYIHSVLISVFRKIWKLFGNCLLGEAISPTCSDPRK